MKEAGWRGGWIVVVGMFVSFLVRLPLVFYNLPVAGHIDERLGLAMLVGFAGGDLNPNFFEYPTFLFYVTHFVWLPFEGVVDVLVVGRVLNLVFACGLGGVVFLLGRDGLGSAPAGALAALFTLFSPTLIHNTSYLSTDVPMTFFIMLGFLLLWRFFRQDDYRFWLAGVLCLGLAVASKYTGAMAVGVYLLMEFSLPAGDGEQVNRRWINRALPRQVLPLAGFVVGVVGVLAYLLIPEDFAVGLLQQGAGVNSIIDASDLAFIERMWGALLVGGVGLMGVSVVIFLRPGLARRLAFVRPYVALGLMGLTFLLTSPYALLGWKQFAYDIGFQLKANQTGAHVHWAYYPAWYRLFESEWVAVLALVGVGVLLWRWWRDGSRFFPFYLMAFFLLNYLSMGAALRGAPRYMTPILPILFVFAGYGLVGLVGGLNRWQRRWRVGYVVLLGLLSLVVVELVPKVMVYTGRVNTTDEMYQSYQFLLENEADHIIFAGYAPDVELSTQGIWLEEYPRTLFTENRAIPVSADYLVVDRDVYQTLDPSTQPNLELVWFSESGFGQYVYRIGE